MNNVSWNLMSLIRVCFAKEEDIEKYSNVFEELPISPNSEELSWKFIKEMCNTYLKHYENNKKEENVNNNNKTYGMQCSTTIDIENQLILKSIIVLCTSK